MSRILAVMICALSVFALQGCAPEIGSERWCANLKEKPKGDWTANEASDYARHCLFKSSNEK